MKKRFTLLLICFWCFSLLASDEWYTFTPSNSDLPGFNTTKIIIKDGKKFIATTKGIAVYDDVTWQITSNANGLPSNFCNAIAAKGDSIAVGTVNGGIAFFDGNTWTTFNIGNGVPSNTIYDVEFDQSGNLWCGTPLGMGFYDGTSWVKYSTANVGFFPSNTIRDLIVDSTNTIWLAAESSGSFQGALAKFNQTNSTVTPYRTLNGLVDNNLISLYNDSDGNIWAGSYNGLSLFDGFGFTNFTTTNSGLTSNWVRGVVLDTTGVLWVATNMGLNRYDGTNWTVYNTSNSELPNNSINSIALDDENNIWLGTPGGLTIFKEGGISATNLPDKAVISGFETICEGDSVAFPIESFGGTEPLTVYASDGSVFSNVEFNDTLMFAFTAGSATVTLDSVKDAFGDKYPNLPGLAFVNINTNPIVQVDTFEFSLVCQQSSPQLLPDATPLGGVYSGTGVDNGGFDPSISGLGNFMVYYEYVGSNGCSAIDSTDIQVDVCSGLVNKVTKLNLNVYPNPVKGGLLKIEGAGLYQITDVYGHVLVELENNGTDWLDVSSLDEGIYFIQSSDRSSVQRIIIE